MDRSERRARIKSLTAIAMALIREHGDRGIVDLAAGRAKSREFRYDEFRLSHLRWQQRHVPDRLEIFNGCTRVVLVEWTQDRVTKTSFAPGDWEARVLRSSQLRHLA